MSPEEFPRSPAERQLDRANETSSPHEEISVSRVNHTPAPGADVRCGDCGKHLPGWTYRPMFVQCDDCADAEEAAQRNAIADIAAAHLKMRDAMIQEAETAAAFVHENVVADIEAFGPPLPELAARTGIGMHHLSKVVAGRDELTVTELVLIAIVLNKLAGDWFPNLEGEYEFPAAAESVRAPEATR